MQRYTGFWRKNIGLKIMTDKAKNRRKARSAAKIKRGFGGQAVGRDKKHPGQHPVDAAGVCF